MKHLKESLLDGFDEIAKKQDTDTYLINLYNKYDNDTKKGCDVFGRKIKKGDLVILNQSHGSPCTGRVIDMNNGEAAVSLIGDGSDITILAGPHKGEIGGYWPTYYMIKIDDKILELLYKLK